MCPHQAGRVNHGEQAGRPFLETRRVGATPGDFRFLRAGMTKCGNNLGFEIRNLGFKLQFCHLLAGKLTYL